jgi:hypothetical protein
MQDLDIRQKALHHREGRTNQTGGRMAKAVNYHFAEKAGSLDPAFTFWFRISGLGFLIIESQLSGEIYFDSIVKEVNGEW